MRLEAGAEAAEGISRAEPVKSAGWRVVIATAVCLSLGPSVLLYMCFGVFAPALHQRFGWDIADISIGGTLLALSVMVVSPIQGYLVDRFGARRSILASAPLFALGLAGMAQMNGDIRWFYAGYAVLPILAAGLWPLAYMRLVSTWFNEHLGLALGVATAGIGFGAALVPALVGALLGQYGLSAAYGVLAGLVLILVWPLAFLVLKDADVRRGPGARDVPLQASSEDVPTAAAARTATFWKLLLAFLLMGAISSAILIHQTTLLISHGLLTRTAILLQSVLGLTSIVGRFAAGWLLDRVRISLLMPLLLALTAAACALYASSTTSVLLLAAGAASFGLLIGAEFDVLGFAIRRYFGMRSFGRIFGVMFSMFQLGSALGAAGLGLSHRMSSSYVAGMLLLGVCSAVAALLLATLGPYRFRAVHGDVAGAPRDGRTEALLTPPGELP